MKCFRKAGVTDQATKILKSLIEDGLTEAEEVHLRGVIAVAQGEDSVAVRKTQFKHSDSLGDLASLVDELEAKQDWEGLGEFGRLMFDRTRSVQDAKRFATALSNTHRNEQLIEFLRQHPDFLAQSKHLQFLFALALYYEGKLIESRSELAKLRQGVHDPIHQTLEVNITIAIGDWISLNTIVANEYTNRGERSAEELISAAQIAVRLGSPHAKDLVFSAVEKGKDDADILATAYYLASRAGWEDDVQVFQWLEKATNLSGDEGPLYPMSLKEILERKPNWDRWESEARQRLVKGEIPLFVAARSLNQSLINLTLFPALANQEESDLRRRVLVPSYSGKRRTVEIRPAETTAGLDATALLTLGFLNLLDQALDAFKEIFIPHSTLAWLFDENQRATFHQPSRIRESHRIRQLISTDALEQFVPSVLPESDLAAEIGDELALMIAEAEKEIDENNIQHVVVRSAPVRRIQSLLEEEADLSAHISVLRSCTDVVEKLRQRGQITTDEAKKAISYLQLCEKPWSNQGEIADDAVLYLDDLAITYLLHLDLLGKIRAAGLQPIASSRVVSEANSFITYESFSNEVKGVTERIRSALRSRIESGSIKVGRRFKTDASEEQLLSEHPTIDVFGLTHYCDLIFSDDRFLNQRTQIDNGESRSTIATSLDLIDALVDIGEVLTDERIEYWTRLRRAGYIFIPVCEEELIQSLNTSEIRDGKLIESAELKSIRESILQVRMSNWLQMPNENDWLLSIIETFIRVLKNLWVDDFDITNIVVRSNWLVDQIDMRGWAHLLGAENGDSFVRLGRGEYIMMLLMPSMNMSKDVREAYWSWIEDRILAPIQEQFSELFTWMIDYQKSQIADVTETRMKEE